MTLETLKTFLAVGGVIFGAFGVGTVVGKNGEIAVLRGDQAVQGARLDAHLAPGTMHPETVTRLNEIRAEVKETRAAANQASIDASATRQLLERMQPALRNANYRGK